MIILDYIKENIGKLLEFTGVECIRYGVSKWTGAHIIEVTPANVFKSDDYINIEVLIAEEFEMRFPMDELIFISNSDIISLSETLYSVSRESISESLKDIPNLFEWKPTYKVNLNDQLYLTGFSNESTYGLPLAA